MFKREAPKFSRENYSSWCRKMRLHLRTLGDSYWTHVEVKYVELAGQLSLDQIKKKKVHITTMDALANTLSYFEYKDVENLEITYMMWEKLKIIYGGDKHVMRKKMRP